MKIVAQHTRLVSKCAYAYAIEVLRKVLGNFRCILLINSDR